MRNIIKLVLILLSVGIVSCMKNDPNSYPDYKYSTTYLPYQTPVRILELGDDYLIDNSGDNKLQFSIGVDLGGMYANNANCNVGYVVDESLTKNLFTDKGDTIVPLPQAYYTLSPVGTVTVPKGQMSASINVQLTDAFLDDPWASKVRYVIPIRLTSTQTDSLLKGKASILNPDRRIANNWTIVPKDYTLFGIKYINPYTGNFMHRGKDVFVKTTTGVKDSMIYRTLYVENNEIWNMQTKTRNQVSVTGQLRWKPASPGNFIMLLTFDAIGNCIITKDPTSNYNVTGSGIFVKQGDEWGGKKRNTIILNYQVTDLVNSVSHQINDTLVVRDRGINVQIFNPIVK